MPAVDTTYIIGVIRHLERGLLEADEYTRLTRAASTADAMRVLRDTPYGQWMDPSDGNLLTLLEALTKRLTDIQRWLVDVLDEPAVLLFIMARYDLLNLGTAILEYEAGQPEPRLLSGLGSINPLTIHSVVWNDRGWDALPEVWEPFLRQERERLERRAETRAWKSGLLQRLEQQYIAQVNLLAHTPLMRALAQFEQDRVIVDAFVRRTASRPYRLSGMSEPLSKEASLAELAAHLQRVGYTELSLEVLEAVRRHESSIAYELAWDSSLLRIIAPYRFEPVGYDPILAFWRALELEVGSIRLVLTGKFQGLAPEALESLVRKPYRSSL